MAKRYEQFKATDWVRTCQECGHHQVMVSPENQKSDNWKDAKCRKCKSQSLDYGMLNVDYSDDWSE